jgi:ribosomal protein L40E
MSASQFRLFVAGMIALAAIVWGVSKLNVAQKRAAYVKVCIDSYAKTPDLRTSCETKARNLIR